MELKRSLSGLKKAVKIWNQLLFKILKQLGFKENETLPCLFISRGIIIICYVHDLFLFAIDEAIIEEKS